MVKIKHVSDCGQIVPTSVYVQDNRGTFVKGFLGNLTYRDVFVTTSLPRCIRGMHVLLSNSTKIVTIVSGSVRDIVCRRASDELIEVSIRDISAGTSLLVPPWHAHGYEVTGQVSAVIQYACTHSYQESTDSGFDPLSPEMADLWIGTAEWVISERDRNLPNLSEWIQRWKQ
jgi:dTDP-4-dehydrorhamnose 3,5-epimerase-like enzyme